MKRYDICKDCSHFNSFWKTCDQCKCFMPIKVLINSAKCPKGYWRENYANAPKKEEKERWKEKK
jgi:hypothetical protein